MSIDISPKDAGIEAGKTVIYTVTGYDSQGANFDLSTYCTYEIQNGAEGSWNGSIYTAENVGAWQVTAEYYGLIDSTILSVNPATMTRLDIVIPDGFDNGIGRIWRSDIAGVILNFTISDGEVAGDVCIANGHEYQIQIVTNDGLTEHWWPDQFNYQLIPAGTIQQQINF